VPSCLSLGDRSEVVEASLPLSIGQLKSCTLPFTLSASPQCGQFPLWVKSKRSGYLPAGPENLTQVEYD
jgi:hypothetical protein